MDQIDEMKMMIRNEIQSIDSLEERVIFKELMEGVFLSLYETNLKMYRALEERVMNDLSYDINRYLIRTGLIERNYLDKSHHLMTAMCEEDTKSQIYTAGEIREKIKEEGKFALTTVFLQSDFLEIRAIMDKRKSYTGIVKAGEEYKIAFMLEPCMRYLNKIEHLYHLFMKNGVPWQTVNSPYLYKMADVVITHLPDEIPDNEMVINLLMDLGEYNQIIHYDMIPIWNVRHLRLDSVGFPVACGDYQNYEHVISIQDYGTQNSYLVEEKTGIRKVRQSGEKLLVTGATSKSQKWDIYMIQRGDDHKIDRYTYPIMKNDRTDVFSERFQRKTGQIIKTKGELERFVHGFGLEKYIEYQSCTLSGAGIQCQETYSMNFFIKDEIRNGEENKQLTLYFKSKGTDIWLLRDLMSFITSEVQELYPEYRCGGKLV